MLTLDEIYGIIKRISETGGDTPEMMDDLKRLQDEIDEREGMLVRYREQFDGENYKEKYEQLKKDYRDRFFSNEEIKDQQQDDINSDDKSTEYTYEKLFEERED